MSMDHTKSPKRSQYPRAQRKAAIRDGASGLVGSHAQPCASRLLQHGRAATVFDAQRWQRWIGKLTLVSPMKLHDTSLHLSEWQFKRDRVYFAGRHFEANHRAVTLKGNISIALTLLLSLEMLLFVLWMARVAPAVGTS